MLFIDVQRYNCSTEGAMYQALSEEDQQARQASTAAGGECEPGRFTCFRTAAAGRQRSISSFCADRCAPLAAQMCCTSKGHRCH